MILCLEEMFTVGSHLNCYKQLHTKDELFQCAVLQNLFRHASNFATLKTIQMGEKGLMSVPKALLNPIIKII